MSRLASDSKSNINDKSIRTDTVWHLGVCECVKCDACREVIKRVCGLECPAETLRVKRTRIQVSAPQFESVDFFETKRVFRMLVKVSRERR